MKIGFSYPKKFKLFSYLISKWINEPYSHCYLLMEVRSAARDTVYHAAHGSVHFREYNKFQQENKIISEYEIEVTPDQKALILQLCIDLAGDDYGFIELPKILLSDMCHYLKCPLFKTYDGKGYICSELIGTILVDILGYKTDIPKHLLKPNDIEEMLKRGKT